MAYQIYGYDFGPFAPLPKPEAKRTAPTFGPELSEPDGDGKFWFHGDANGRQVNDMVRVSGGIANHRMGVDRAYFLDEMSGRWWRIVPPGGGE